ncbi:hypothetical protein [Silvanigrella sp.]|jgi:phage tail sheath gpL-like|uniref:hypothetical protein n=1 Tax=Silvanigrella sp. TaxID=2024976 RepID=UPI0037C85536
MVSFNTITDTRQPSCWIEFDTSAASGANKVTKTLLISTANIDDKLKENHNKLFRLSSEKTVIDIFGRNTIMHEMFISYKDNDIGNATELWGMAVPNSNIAAKITYKIPDTMKENEYINFTYNGYWANVAYSLITKNIEDEFNKWMSQHGILFTVKVNSANNKPSEIVVTSTQKTAALNGKIGIFKVNEVETKLEFSGGVSSSFEISKIFKDIIKDFDFDFFVSSFVDKTILEKFSAELEKRWHAAKQLDGVLVYGTNNKATADTDKFDDLNTPYIIYSAYHKSPKGNHEISAALAAAVAVSVSIDPARPLQTVPLNGIDPPDVTNRLQNSEVVELLNRGIGVINTVGTTARIERLLTAYKKNDAGLPDESLLSPETVFTLSFIRRDFKNYFWSKYSRFKLAKNTAVVSPSQKILTPKLAKCEAISRFLHWEQLGLVQDSKDFIENLVVEIDEKNKGRLNFLLPPTLIRQLIQTAVQIQFR